MHARSTLLVLGLLAVAGGGAGHAEGQPAPDPHAETRHTAIEVDNCPAPPAGMTPDQVKAAASEHFDRGQVLYDQGDYTRAVADLVWAYCMVPRYYTILKSIGQAYERALEYEKAIAYFELYVAKIPPDATRPTPCDPDPQADRFAMTSRISVLKRLPARIQIDTPVKASIELTDQGGIAGRQTESGAPIDVPGGKIYKATIRAPGYVTTTIDVATQVGRPTTEYVRLDRETGKLRIRVTPTEAKIALDDRYVGTGQASVTVEAKHYTVSLDAADYEPRSFGIDVLPGSELDQPYELSPTPQVGRRQLLLYAGGAGAVAGFAALGVSGNGPLAGAGFLLGGTGAAIAVYYGTERAIPLGTSSLTITSSLIGGVGGLDIGLIAAGEQVTLFADGQENRNSRAYAGAGLVAGGVAGYLIGEREHISAGDAAVVNSGALWGGVAGHLLGFSFGATNPEIGGLGLVGMAMGTTGGVVLTQYYAASRKHAALIDAAGVVGMITGVATSNLIFNQNGGGTPTAQEQERTADFALGGLALGLITGGVLTRTLDAPKLPAQLQMGHATTTDGKSTATYGIGGVF